MSIINDTRIQRTMRELLVSGFSQGDFAGTTGEEIKYLFSWPPEILTDSNYTDPWSAGNPAGKMSSVESISRLVDPIPLCRDIYTPSGESVEGVYGDIILSASPILQGGPHPPAKGGSLPLTSKQTFPPPGPIRDDLLLRLTDDVESRSAERELSLKIAQRIFAKGGKKEPTAELESLKKALGKLKEKEGARLGSVERIYGAGGTVKAGGLVSVSSLVSRILSKANTLFQATQTSSLDNPQITYHPSSVIPVDFALLSESDKWGNLEIDVEDENDRHARVSMKYTRAEIIRPWFVSHLLYMDGWTLEGQPSGWLSTGGCADNNGLFPLLPVSFILCREFRIKGPGDLCYKADGLQIICRCCKVTPRMAPR